ncbi:MAG: methionyl-tRNA formyltransferase [Rhodomicrobium sp.]
MALRVVFMGTPDFSVPALSEIVGAGHDVVGVYTQPPRPAGRGMEDRKSPVHAFADEAAIPVFTPKTLRRPEIQEEFASLAPDVAVVAAYGLILPLPVLETPPLGCLNLHASLLPRWRGAAPIQRAIMAGDKETGVMVMKMEQGLDTGPVALADRLLIAPDATAGEIHDQLSLMGASLMLTALQMLENRDLFFTPQPEKGVTYAPKISKDETRIDWTKSGPEVHNHLRGLSPYPGAWFEALLGGKAERIKVLRSVLVPGKGDPGQLLDTNLTVACGSQAVRLTQVQRAGKRPIGGADFLRGFPLGKGTQFG